MVKNRTNQKNLWVDKEFLRWLKTLKAKKQINGGEVTNLGELTRELINTEAIKDVERQILKEQNMANIKIKLDARRLF